MISIYLSIKAFLKTCPPDHAQNFCLIGATGGCSTTERVGFFGIKSLYCLSRQDRNFLLNFTDFYLTKAFIYFSYELKYSATIGTNVEAVDITR